MDFRSDTLTKPTKKMRQQMAIASVGDDVYGEDPTVNQLEQLAANMLGKEKALFFPSGTMANQVAVLTHTTPGDEVIVESDAHIFYYELGGLARLGGVQARTISSQQGQMPLAQIEKAIRAKDLHFPTTKLICLENTHNRKGGAVLPLDYLDDVGHLAKKHQLKVHMDGARLFNAVVALGVSPKQVVKNVDSVMFSLSKGLAAPIGSLLLGSQEFIEEAKKWRKMLGGGMRQAGVVAACGIVALEEMVERLAEDHAHAKQLALALAKIPGLKIDLTSVQTNIVIVNVAGTRYTGKEFVSELANVGIKAALFDENDVRLVTHKDISSEDIKMTIKLVYKILEE